MDIVSDNVSHTPFSNPDAYINVVDNSNMDGESTASAPRMLDAAAHGHETLLCDYVDVSTFMKHGTMIQFINSNAVGHSNMIGSIRIGQEDIRKVQAYLAKYRQNLRVYGAGFLMRHLQDTQCPTAALEIVASDDLGISFSLASLSGRGLLLNPGKRNEGPLSFAMYPGLIEPVFIRDLGHGQGAYCHVVNCYLHMLPAAQRRNTVVLKALAEKKENVVEIVDPKMTVVTKKRKQYPVQQNQGAPYNGPGKPFVPYISNRQSYLETLTKEMEKRQKESDDRCADLERKLKAVSIAPGYPPLPN